MTYLILKYIHILCVAASFALFFIRGIWVIRAYPSAQEPWAKAFPHFIDALLVASAIGMLYVSFSTAWGGSWMIVKLVLVLIYAVLVSYVLHVAKTKLSRIAFWSIALLLFLVITSIAVLHHPLGFLMFT